MPVFPSDAWMDEFCERLVAQPDAGELAGALAGSYRFVVEPAGPLSRTMSFDLEIRPDGDGGASATRLERPAPDPRLVLTATYERWRQLVTGRLDVTLALMLRRLKVTGDLPGLVRGVGSAASLTRTLAQVDSVWLDG